MSEYSPTREKEVQPPALNDETRAGLKDFWEIYDRHYDWFLREVEAIVSDIPGFAPVFRSQDPAQRSLQNRENRLVMRAALVEDDWYPLLNYLRHRGSKYAREGIPFRSWSSLLAGFRELAMPLLQQDLAGEPARLLRAIAALCRYLDFCIAVIGQAYLATKEATIKRKEEAIQQLSTPVLKVRKSQLILPVVGLVDSQRAARITDALLGKIREHRARAVVMDITGLPMVDASVADHMLRTVTAARLMGSEVVITGISPEIAQTLVSLGMDLSSLRTFGDLQSGLEWADRLLGLAVVPLERLPGPRPPRVHRGVA